MSRSALPILIAASLATVAPCTAQTVVRGVVVDQTGLPLPGATVQLVVAGAPVANTTTSLDGTFMIEGDHLDGTLTVSMAGFETVTVGAGEASRIVLPIARATETTTVVAPPLPQDSPVAPLVGTQLGAATLARLPSSRLRAKESLPLLPSVVRGNDGLLRVGGARPYETPLLVDGFNVTDPATGISNINLPFEAVRGVEVLRDPMAVSFGGLVGGVMQLESRPGGDHFKMGVQGFVPRPRFQNPNFGRLEGIFPRVFAGGTALGRVRYFGSVEYDYERIPVPEVSEVSGRDVIEESATLFARVDVDLSTRHSVTVEGLVFPAVTKFAGLSPLRDELATSHNRNTDLFAGVTDRLLLESGGVLTIKVSVLGHSAVLTPAGTGPSYLSPTGWRGNWFATVDRAAVRQAALATLERTLSGRLASHTVTVGGSVAPSRLRGSVTETPIAVQDEGEQIVRTVDFSAAAPVAAHHVAAGGWMRDVWRARSRLDVDSGVRLDYNSFVHRVVPSARAGIRLGLDAAGRTVLKAGVGRFIGELPLAIEAFTRRPTRIDRFVDPATGGTMRTITLRPDVGAIDLPRAVAATAAIEQQLTTDFDAQVGVTVRNSGSLATLNVPAQGGPMPVQSTGHARYRELQIAIRRTWPNDQQLFVSYVRSTSRGELNDFAALFQSLDAPLLRPGGMSRTPTDARNRWLAWGTFNFPRRIVVSPVAEIRSGFPFSVFDRRYDYAGSPNTGQFPLFMALDVVAYKTFTVKHRSADLGIQLFNATNHFNPRDVYPIAGSSRYGSFANSVGPILRGFMLIKW